MPKQGHKLVMKKIGKSLTNFQHFFEIENPKLEWATKDKITQQTIM
jgi:preprotein translocase subunit SecE